MSARIEQHAEHRLSGPEAVRAMWDRAPALLGANAALVASLAAGWVVVALGAAGLAPLLCAPLVGLALGNLGWVAERVVRGDGLRGPGRRRALWAGVVAAAPVGVASSAFLLAIGTRPSAVPPAAGMMLAWLIGSGTVVLVAVAPAAARAVRGGVPALRAWRGAPSATVWSLPVVAGWVLTIALSGALAVLVGPWTLLAVPAPCAVAIAAIRRKEDRT